MMILIMINFNDINNDNNDEQINNSSHNNIELFYLEKIIFYYLSYSPSLLILFLFLSLIAKPIILI